MNPISSLSWRAALVAASLVTASTGVATAKSYIVLSSGSGLPAGLEKKIAAAGGSITRTIPQIGIAIASSDNPDFALNASAIQGIRSTSPNITLQWLPKGPSGDGLIVEDVGNPPASLDDDRLFDLQWGHAAIEAPAAWNAGYRGAGVRVAVLDSGIAHSHPDLAPNLNSDLSKSFVPGEDWRVRPGRFFNHGTHVAGTIAAADNGFGVIGVAPEAEIVALKVLSEFTGSGDFDFLISALVYAGDIQAQVINMSLGAYLPRHGIYENGVKVATAKEISELLVALGRATTYAHNHGALLIASAGNDAIDADHDADGVSIPAMSPHVLRIAATAPYGWAENFNGDLDLPASYSNYGQSFISLSAPGGDFIYPGETLRSVAGVVRPAWVFDLVFSTIAGNAFGWAAGTSMAAPHVSGVAALIIGKANGNITPAGVESILRRSSEDLGKPGKDDHYGAGRVNALQAVQ